jgi:hypothetical protein
VVNPVQNPGEIAEIAVIGDLKSQHLTNDFTDYKLEFLAPGLKPEFSIAL